MKPLAVIALSFSLLLFTASCNQKAEDPKETVEIKRMDSTTKVVETHTDKVKDQTKKVEESLEKLDKEFENEQ